MAEVCRFERPVTVQHDVWSQAVEGGRAQQRSGYLAVVDTDACASYNAATISKEEQQSDKPAKTGQGNVRIQARGSATSSARVRVRLIPDIEELKKSVSNAELRKQGFTANLPRTIEIVPSTDNSGENSLDVTVYFPKTMKEEDVASAQTSRMLSWIQDTILSKAESDGRWPYVFVKVDGKDTHVASKL